MHTEKYIRNNPDKINWNYISKYPKLSEDFIREFQDKINWKYISIYQKLSEDFIREFHNKIYWNYISYTQKLSEKIIREFQNKVNWKYISHYQKLSEDFIREFQNKVNWYYITIYQKLSEDFIREFQDKFDWDNISKNQILRKEFIKEFEDKINKEEQLKTHHNKLSLQEKQILVKKYCKKYKLIYDDNYFYAFRDHNINGSGIWNKTISYEKNKYYQDWRCNLNSYDANSFGYGINPEGNTKVKIKIEDIGCWINESNKLRVWGFEII